MKTEQTSNVSVESILRKQFESVGFNVDDSQLHCYISGGIFGANWQKEQDKAIIEELLGLLKLAKMYSCPPSDFITRLNYIKFADDAHLAIDHAEQYINQ